MTVAAAPLTLCNVTAFNTAIRFHSVNRATALKGWRNHHLGAASLIDAIRYKNQIAISRNIHRILNVCRRSVPIGVGWSRIGAINGHVERCAGGMAKPYQLKNRSQSNGSNAHVGFRFCDLKIRKEIAYIGRPASKNPREPYQLCHLGFLNAQFGALFSATHGCPRIFRFVFRSLPTNEVKAINCVKAQPT